MSTLRAKNIESPDAEPVAIPSLDKRMATAWVNFNGTGTVAIRGSYNVASITDNGTGQYVANFTVPMNNPDYSAVVSMSNQLSTDNGIYLSKIGGLPTAAGVPVTTQLGTVNTYYDAPLICVVVFGGRP